MSLPHRDTDLRIVDRLRLEGPGASPALDAVRPSLSAIADAAYEYHFYGYEDGIRALFPPLETLASERPAGASSRALAGP